LVPAVVRCRGGEGDGAILGLAHRDGRARFPDQAPGVVEGACADRAGAEALKAVDDGETARSGARRAECEAVRVVLHRGGLRRRVHGEQDRVRVAVSRGDADEREATRPLHQGRGGPGIVPGRPRVVVDDLEAARGCDEEKDDQEAVGITCGHDGLCISSKLYFLVSQYHHSRTGKR
jgi:hypothetical protein